MAQGRCSAGDGSSSDRSRMPHRIPDGPVVIEALPPGAAGWHPQPAKWAPLPGSELGHPPVREAKVLVPPSRRHGEVVPCPMFLMGESSRLVLHLVVSDTRPALPRLL